mmetsp:Transcript_3010/g.7038  ORF Transcript_3010/g.7038 Transcript_3010/m.7038 type:complete len:399 (-) Transcript_3010:1896-3092(-)
MHAPDRLPPAVCRVLLGHARLGHRSPVAERAPLILFQRLAARVQALFRDVAPGVRIARGAGERRADVRQHHRKRAHLIHLLALRPRLRTQHRHRVHGRLRCPRPDQVHGAARRDRAWERVGALDVAGHVGEVEHRARPPHALERLVPALGSTPAHRLRDHVGDADLRIAPAGHRRPHHRRPSLLRQHLSLARQRRAWEVAVAGVLGLGFGLVGVHGEAEHLGLEARDVLLGLGRDLLRRVAAADRGHHHDFDVPEEGLEREVLGGLGAAAPEQVRRRHARRGLVRLEELLRQRAHVPARGPDPARRREVADDQQRRRERAAAGAARCDLAHQPELVVGAARERALGADDDEEVAGEVCEARDPDEHCVPPLLQQRLPLLLRLHLCRPPFVLRGHRQRV